MSDVRVTRDMSTADRADFVILFSVGDHHVQAEPLSVLLSVVEGKRRGLRLGFSNALVAILAAADPAFTLDNFAQQVGEALLANGAAERPHTGYLFQTNGDLRDPNSLLFAIVEDSDRFAWPSSIPG
jgi:hypothetical protein